MQATLQDIPRLAALGQRFHAASGMPFGYDPDQIAGFLQGLIENESGVVLCSEQSLICGVLSPAYCDPNWMMAVELAWWSEDRQGLKLLRAFEAWARDKGANEVRMTTLCSLPAAEKIMSRTGYAPAEISYRKVI
ncbi:MAG: hypothetical protein MRY81_10110 [Donghicola eburneus]|jgi:hypothetical protein|nr:hypothetical protein [Donghicola eburneus]MCI5040026.1 hypothetical protein [Donghicola eburneus]